MAPVNEPVTLLVPAEAAPEEITAGSADHAGDRFTARLFVLGFVLLGLIVLADLLAGFLR
jgi:hypothetical protein